MARARRCWRCLLARRATEILAGPDGEIPARLRRLAEAIISMPRANSGYVWLSSPRVAELLTSLASGDIQLDHAALDLLPASSTVEYVRELLIAHGALPGRDRYLAAFQRWVRVKMEAIASPDHRALIERFVRWDVEHKLRSRSHNGEVTTGSFLRAKQRVTVAITFLAWLDDRSLVLTECSQHDIDNWFTTGTTTRRHATPFINWARRQRILTRIAIPPRQTRDSPAISNDERLAHLRRLLHSSEMVMAHRLIGAFVLLFGQPLSRIVALTRDAVDTTDAATRVRLAQEWIDLPEPLATMTCAYLSQRWNTNTAANGDSSWLFPGGAPGQHLHPASAARALQQAHIPALASRTGAWIQLVREAPPAVLAHALGIDPTTAANYANLAGTDYLAYAATQPRGAPLT